MRYRKKPVVIEAIQFIDTPERLEELSKFIDNQPLRVDYKNPNKPVLKLQTLEGEHIASVGDYIIKGVKGEFYPCKPDIFEMTYEKADSENFNHRSKECIQYIIETTRVDKETIVKILQAEDEYIKYILKIISGGKA